MGLMLLPGLISTSEKEVYDVLKAYIAWTTTGICEEETLFDDTVGLSFQAVGGENAVDFSDYREKVEGAARAVSRNMGIHHVKVENDIATAQITDCSQEHHFDLIHQVTLHQVRRTWKIQSIRIVPKDDLP